MTFIKKTNKGMTIAEVMLAMMVMVIFMTIFSLFAKYFNSNMKITNTNKVQDNFTQDQNRILKSIDQLAEILSQPSYSKDFILSLKCTYQGITEKGIWNLPLSKDFNIPNNYKVCIKKTSFTEGDINQLIEKTENVKPGIYFLYAIPDKITPKTKPLRRIFCRPITFC